MIAHSPDFYMQEALMLAEKGAFTARTNPIVGCILVKNNKIIGKGLHWQAGQNHAEINALENATEDPQGAIAYVTLEPCSHQGRTGPCTQALIKAGIVKVYYALCDPNPLVNGKGLASLKQAGIEVIEIENPLLKKQARLQNCGFHSAILRQKPYTRLKMGMSTDGRIALENGESQWITSANSRADVQLWRAKSGAILSTAKSIMRDNSKLNVRTDFSYLPPTVHFKQPLRVIWDTHLTLTTDLAIFKEPGKLLIVVSETVPHKKISDWLAKLDNDQVEWFALPEKNNHIDFDSLLCYLNKLEIKELFIEAGAEFAGSLLHAQKIDEILFYMAPCFLGDKSKAVLTMPQLSNLEAKMTGQFENIQFLDPDLRFQVLLSDFAREIYGYASH